MSDTTHSETFLLPHSSPLGDFKTALAFNPESPESIQMPNPCSPSNPSLEDKVSVGKPASAPAISGTHRVSLVQGKTKSQGWEQVADTHHDSKEFRKSGVVGSGLRGGEVTKAAALAQFLLQ